MSEAWASLPSPHLTQWAGKQGSQNGKFWSALISVVNSLCFAFHTLICTPLWGFKAPPVPTLRRPETFPLPQLSLRGAGPISVPFFSYNFGPTLLCGGSLAFLDVWDLLTSFRRCSVGVVPCVDVFLMYLWGGGGSPCLILLLSWKSPLCSFFIEEEQGFPEAQLSRLPLLSYWLEISSHDSFQTNNWSKRIR